MRIISGKYKGRVLPQNPKLKARPTTDKAKEALFNILNFELDYPSTKVLDLFSGTGNISFEFASRGVTDITAVELRFEHVKFIANIANKLDIKLNLVKSDVYKFLKKDHDKYDLIFADPPFDMDNFEQIYNAIIDSEITKKGTILIIEHGPNISFSDKIYWESTRNYGKVNFSFFRF